MKLVNSKKFILTKITKKLMMINNEVSINNIFKLSIFAPLLVALFNFENQVCNKLSCHADIFLDLAERILKYS